MGPFANSTLQDLPILPQFSFFSLSQTNGAAFLVQGCLELDRWQTLFDALQAPLQKIDLYHLLTDFTFQLGYPAFGPPPLPITRKRVAGHLTKLTPPTLQYVRINLQPRATSASDTPGFQAASWRGKIWSPLRGSKSHEFFKAWEIFRSDMGRNAGSGIRAHSRPSSASMSLSRISLGGSVSTEPRLCFSGHLQNDVMSSCRSSTLQRTANRVLTVCLSRGGNPKEIWKAAI